MLGSRSLIGALLLACPLSLLSACPSGDPPIEPDAGDGMPYCPLGATMDEIQEKLFSGDKCRTCHHLTPSGAFPLYPTRLDLGSPGLPERMVDKEAYADINFGKCQGRILVPKNDPLNGVFVQKVMDNPPCGVRMPQALPALKPEEISCVKRWAILAAKSVP